MNPEVTHVQWEVLQPLIPPPGRMGRPRADDRQILNGMLYVLRTGRRRKMRSALAFEPHSKAAGRVLRL